MNPITFFCAILIVGMAGAVRALTLAGPGQDPLPIILADQASLAEQTAASELAEYLRQVTGAPFAVISEAQAETGQPGLYVGPTRAARQAGISADQLRPEEWLLQTEGEQLLLVGGRPRGTLYAVYHFLEDVVGVHWWNPWEETVPQRPELTIADLHLRGQPVLQYRDIYMLYGGDGGRFAARNRLNREGDARIDARYGGGRDYGPPYHVHTFFTYFPPAEYFADHPEWYSLINGRRSGDGTQLCLTNPELRQAFLEKLLNFIQTSWAEAQEAHLPPPLVFSVSQNDWQNPCHCGACQALAQAEGSEAGPLLDFVNFLADGIRDRYPEVYLDTLAYQYTQKAPRTLRPRDNVIIRLCDTDSDPTKPITSPENAAFREHLLSWARIAKNLRIWDYAVTYANPVGMPMPTAQTYDDDFRFYAEHQVEGVFTELEFPILADLRDFKVWMMMKLLENPYADYEGLVRTFTEGFYGPAGRSVREYLAALETAARASQTRLGWTSTPPQMTYLDLGFVTRGQRIFDQAEQAVGEDPVLLRRVRHARLPLDRATVILYARLWADWLAQGQPADLALPDREAVAQRALDTWLVQARLRLPEAQQEAEKQAAEAEMRRYTLLPTSVAWPEKFRGLPRDRVFDYLATMTRNWQDIVKVVQDPEAESGITNRLDLTAEDVPDADRYTLPLPWGLYDVVNKQGYSGAPIRAEDIPGPGYHWYKMGTFRLGPSYYLYFFWSWIIQVDVDNAYDPRQPDQQFEIWARLKFEGPRFPHGRAEDPDAICVERVVLVKQP